MYYDYKKVFLDYDYETSFLDLCVRENIIQPPSSSYSKKRINYKQKVLCYLSLYETIDFSHTIADLSPLVDRGIIEEASNCYSNPCSDFQQINKEHIDQANNILLFYKDDIIRKIVSWSKRSFERNKQRIPSWKNITFSHVFLGVQHGENGLSLAKDYENIITMFDDLYLDNYDGDFGNVYFDIDVIRNSLIQGINSSITTNAVYASSFMTLHQTEPVTSIVDNIYYLIETQLPNEANILPMPSSIDEAIKMKNSPEMKSFRKVLSEWCHYFSNNEFGMVEKIKKDIIKANKQFEKLEKYRKFSTSPYTQLVCLLGGFIPCLPIAIPVALTGFIAPYATSIMQKKHLWAIETTKR